jgi:hypothetical protein
MRTSSILLLLLAIAVGFPSFSSPALAAGVHSVQGRSRHPRHRRSHHRQRERRHEERAPEHTGEL